MPFKRFACCEEWRVASLWSSTGHFTLSRGRMFRTKTDKQATRLRQAARACHVSNGAGARLSAAAAGRGIALVFAAEPVARSFTSFLTAALCTTHLLLTERQTHNGEAQRSQTSLCTWRHAYLLATNGTTCRTSFADSKSREDICQRALRPERSCRHVHSHMNTGSCPGSCFRPISVQTKLF